jgi:hypothetical protein
LEKRRELGLIFRDRKAIKRLVETFEEDWRLVEKHAGDEDEPAAPVKKVARKVAKAVARELPPVAPVLEVVVREVTGTPNLPIDPEQVEETVKEAVKEAVKKAAKDVVETVAASNLN